MLHVIAGFSLGGTEMTCLGIATHARGRFGVENRVLALSDASAALRPQFEAVCDGRVHALQAPASRVRTLIAANRLIREYRPDAVICHLFGVAHLLIGASCFAAKQTGVICAAGNPAPAVGETKARFNWRCLIAASRTLKIPIVSASRYIQASLAALGSRLPRGSGVIHNGCDVAAIAAVADAARARRSERTFVIGMIARLDPIKDHDTLLKAWAMLCSRPSWGGAELWIAGDGLEADRLQRLAETLGVAASVRFLGARNDVPALLGGMDVFVLSTTRAEGFGIVLIEALAAGVPVVASDVPACREVLADGELGRLVPPADAGALADAIESLRRDEKLRRTRAQAGRQAAQERFDFASTTRAYLEAVLRVN